MNTIACVTRWAKIDKRSFEYEMKKVANDMEVTDLGSGGWQRKWKLRSCSGFGGPGVWKANSNY